MEKTENNGTVRQMNGVEMKYIRGLLGLSTVELARACGYEGKDTSVAMVIRRFESGSEGRVIPSMLAQLLRMYAAHGVPREVLPPGARSDYPRTYSNYDGNLAQFYKE